MKKKKKNNIESMWMPQEGSDPTLREKKKKHWHNEGGTVVFLSLVKAILFTKIDAHLTPSKFSKKTPP